MQRGGMNNPIRWGCIEVCNEFSDYRFSTCIAVSFMRWSCYHDSFLYSLPTSIPI